MSNPKKKSKLLWAYTFRYTASFFGGNKGKQMQDKSGEHAQVIQTKGE